jgi:hypothetical protein
MQNLNLVNLPTFGSAGISAFSLTSFLQVQGALVGGMVVLSLMLCALLKSEE